ncbi:MAG: 2-amino-4-hydroxy-6-hydroxymethyldihydropteridine diphosphokinase [Acidimicrobiia bacterium]
MTEAIVALGTNLGDRWATLAEAVADLETVGRVVAVSPAYETAPIGGPEQGAFLNAVVAVDTAIDPEPFLAALHRIEAAHGRVRDVRWGPRTLDLDLVAHGDAASEGRVDLPHPRAVVRRFVLQPLADVRPEFRFPDGRGVIELLPTVADQAIEQVGGPDWWLRATTRPERPLRVVIAGPGRAGSALATAAGRAGHEIVAAISRSGGDAGVGAPARTWDDDLPDCDLVLLTVPDRALLVAGATLVGRVPPGAVVVHCSGITPLSVLQPLVDAGHRVGGLHPLAALPDAERGAAALAGAGMALAGDDDVVDLLADFARSLGGVPFRIDEVGRPAYHAAASIAANHVTTLLGAVEELARAAGVPFEVYRPLVEGAVAGAFEAGPAGALTGPVARGDEGTVALQRRSVEEAAPDLLPLLDALNEATRRLAG